MEHSKRVFETYRARRSSGTSRICRFRVAAVAGAIAVVVIGFLAGGVARVRAAIERVGAPAPDFTCERCLNHAPFKLSDLRGKVVLVDFWEYTCINCIRTFPYLRRWDQLYRPLGLVIVGVHTPEFEFGKKASIFRSRSIATTKSGTRFTTRAGQPIT